MRKFKVGDKLRLIGYTPSSLNNLAVVVQVDTERMTIRYYRDDGRYTELSEVSVCLYKHAYNGLERAVKKAKGL